MNDMRRAFFEIDASRLERCLSPGLDCTQPAIRAHSIQNAAHLGLLEQDGHVVQLAQQYDSAGTPQIVFERVGRNKASTFTGLCSTHDRELFADIEIQQIDLNDEWHLFLLAYRATLRETHTKMEVGVKAQSAYQARVAAGLDPGDRPSPLGVFATESLMLAYDKHQLKEAFDLAYLNRHPDMLKHNVLRLRVTEPSLATSAMFSLDDIEKDLETVRVYLTILPMSSTETVVVLSYRDREAGLGRLRLDRVLGATGTHQLYEVSRMVLNSCENFVLSPKVFDVWDAEKREAIRSYFVHTLFRDDYGVEDERFMLFVDGT